MRIRNFIHKGLKALYVEGSRKGVPANMVMKLEHMLAFIDRMTDEKQLTLLPVWKAHKLKGDRKDTWSLSVTANKRLTFSIDSDNSEAYDLNLEDYH